ncbi:MAG: HAD hydrolase-like protein [Planctomycetota bacterium]
MSDSKQTLKDLKPTKEFFIGIDSDGCAFDSMEVKHKECFCPNVVKHFHFAGVSKYARETWDFVNLYGRSRGCNRFNALIYLSEWLMKRSEIKARNWPVPDFSALRQWVASESKLGNPALEAVVKKAGNVELATVLAWSKDVNKSVEEIVHGVPPFPGLLETLERAQSKADMIVVSQTPVEALEREWEEHNIDRFVRFIAGQEHGTKTEHLAMAAKGKYPSDKILMLGDAYSDYKAAASNNALFFPILPGDEESSWARLRDEGLDKFFNGQFAGDYQAGLLKELADALPETPAWA